jgi:hypothetical protein
MKSNDDKQYLIHILKMNELVKATRIHDECSIIGIRKSNPKSKNRLGRKKVFSVKHFSLDVD